MKKPFFNKSILLLSGCLISISSFALKGAGLDFGEEADYRSFGTAKKYRVEYYTPPSLDDSNLGERVVCWRPQRKGKPQMRLYSIEKNPHHEQIVIDNYGHGGSGWTLGPGTVNYTIGLLNDAEKKGNISRDTEITVIGAGCIGLMTALELYNQGYRSVQVMAKEFRGLTSHNAGGLLAPVSMANDPTIQPLIDQMGIDAFDYYQKIIAGRHPYLQEGARMVPTYFDSREDGGLEPYVTAGRISPAEDVVLDFGNEHQRTMVRYDDIFMDTLGLMDSLNKAIDRYGIPRIQKEVTSFEMLPSPIVFNCTGLGARAWDEAMVPVQGHLVMLQDQPSENTLSIHNTMILSYGQEDGLRTKAGFPITRSYYQFPKKQPGSSDDRIGVIGGTFIEGAGPNDDHNIDEFDIMIDGARRFFNTTVLPY
jgi:hypothetical protein